DTLRTLSFPSATLNLHSFPTRRSSDLEGLPDPRVEVAPPRHLGAKLDHPAVEGVDRRVLVGDLLLEGPGLHRELTELHPVPEEHAEHGDRDGYCRERGHGGRAWEVEPDQARAVSPDEQQAELLPRFPPWAP